MFNVYVIRSRGLFFDLWCAHFAQASNAGDVGYIDAFALVGGPRGSLL